MKIEFRFAYNSRRSNGGLVLFSNEVFYSCDSCKMWKGEYLIPYSALLHVGCSR